MKNGLSAFTLLALLTTSCISTDYAGYVTVKRPFDLIDETSGYAFSLATGPAIVRVTQDDLTFIQGDFRFNFDIWLSDLYKFEDYRRKAVSHHASAYLGQPVDLTVKSYNLRRRKSALKTGAVKCQVPTTDREGSMRATYYDASTEPYYLVIFSGATDPQGAEVGRFEYFGPSSELSPEVVQPLGPCVPKF
jgi:hypothetical protein